MGGSGSKELSFGDFESTNKDNTEKSKQSKSKSKKDSKGTKSSKIVSSLNNPKSSEQKEQTDQDHDEEGEGKDDESSDHKKEKEEDEESEDNHEEEEEQSGEKKTETKSKEKTDSNKITSNETGEHNEEEEEENHEEEKNETKSKQSGTKSQKSETKSKQSGTKSQKSGTKSKEKTGSNKVTSNEEEKNGEEFREEPSSHNDEISSIKSFMEEKEKKDKKAKKEKIGGLNIPRKEKNGEKFLEGDIEYKKIKMPEVIKEANEEEEKSHQNEEELDEVEKLKKQKMLKEYDFYLTKEIPKTKFINKNKDSNLPMDYANNEVKKTQEKKYLCFVEAKTKKKKKVEIKSNKENQLVRDEIYLFNERQKQIRAIKPLSREEFVQPFSYKVEFEMGTKGISNKVTNKINDNNGYIDVYPNGEAYKFLSSKDDEEKKEKPKKVVYNKVSELDKAKIEEIKKKDENDIVNIINKGLKENQLVEGEKKAENANDF